MLVEWGEFLGILVFVIQGTLAVLVGYLGILTLASILAPRRTPFPARYSPGTRFAILIPAHNEERLLPLLLESLCAQNYPTTLYDVFIVADNCSDRTAEIGLALGARVYERFDTGLLGKGHALNWLWAQMQVGDVTNRYGAVAIFDADTLVGKDFLKVMDARLQAGENAIQGYYSVRDPDRTWGTALRYTALAVLHYLRPLGRNVLGGSAGLKGNGMCFAVLTYRSIVWSGAVTEDIECHTDLVLRGLRVTFAPDARLEAEMPGSLDSAYTQNLRWESGRWQMVRRYALPLLKRAILTPSYVAFDALMEHLIPPTVLLVCLVLASILAGLLVGSWIVFWFGFLLLVVLAFYLIVGLSLVQAPRRVWLSLLYAPRYILWKLGVILRVGAGVTPPGWIRTNR